MAVILRRLRRPDREGRKMTMGESSNLDMQSQFVVELDFCNNILLKGKFLRKHFEVSRKQAHSSGSAEGSS